METVIDWSKAPEDAIGYVTNVVSENCTYEYGRFVTSNGDCTFHYGSYCGEDETYPAKDSYELTRRPIKPVAPVFTQAMADAGELPSVGMMVLISDNYSDVWGDSLHLIECPVQVMAVFDGLGIELGKSIPMVSVSNKGGSSACFRADMCKPLSPPIELIDGKAYQFDYNGRTELVGIYHKHDDSFGQYTVTSSAKAATNIQLLEVK